MHDKTRWTKKKKEKKQTWVYSVYIYVNGSSVVLPYTRGVIPYLFVHVYVDDSINYKAIIPKLTETFFFFLLFLNKVSLSAGLTHIVCCPVSCSCFENNTDRKHNYDNHRHSSLHVITSMSLFVARVLRKRPLPKDIRNGKLFFVIAGDGEIDFRVASTLNR